MDTTKNKVRLFEQQQVRAVWDEKNGKWWFSVPSKKAEPFKQWLARVGSERIDESLDPELSIDCAIQNYSRLGYSEDCINQRIKTIEVRKALTDEWDKAGVKQGQEYAFLTDLMYKTWSGMNTRQYKNFKELKKESARKSSQHFFLKFPKNNEKVSQVINFKNQG